MMGQTYEYQMLTGTTTIDSILHTTYGVQCYHTISNAVVFSIPDVTSDADGMQALISKWNAAQLSPLHLRDVIDDSLS